MKFIETPALPILPNSLESITLKAFTNYNKHSDLFGMVSKYDGIPDTVHTLRDDYVEIKRFVIGR